MFKHIYFKTREAKKKKEVKYISNNYIYDIWMCILFNMNISSHKDINPLNMMIRLEWLTLLYDVFCVCVRLSLV